MNVRTGFIELLDAKSGNGTHMIRAAHISAIRPAWDEYDVWTGCYVFTLDGSVRQVNASLEQIMDAIAKVEVA